MKVLIFRPGSIGDIVVALPCLHLIARVFPQAERRVLTCAASNPDVSPVEQVLGPSGLIHSHLSYPVNARAPAELGRVWRWVWDWRPDVLIYLAEPRSLVGTWRDAAFLRLCGIPRIVGLPLRQDLRAPKQVGAAGMYEHAAERLARGLRTLGDAKVEDPAAWDLRLTPDEEETAGLQLAEWPGRQEFIALGAGARVAVKDWGQQNWSALLSQLEPTASGMGIVFVGSQDDAGRARGLAASWKGPVLNVCGKLSLRESAAVIRRARLYVGHDGGLMHLAHAVGTRCVAVFSGHAKPGVWFPYGSGHDVLYHRTPCFGCGLDTCIEHGQVCIASITVGEVQHAVSRIVRAA